MPDLLTNLVACAANQVQLFDQVQDTIDKTKVENVQVYEYHFNMSQALLKKKQFKECLEAIGTSRDLLKQEGEHATEADNARFKIQELHMLN